MAPEVLTTIANAARDRERLRFDYTGHDGAGTCGTWSRTGWCTGGAGGISSATTCERKDWRTFRVDRLRPRTPTGPRFTARELPADGDVAAFVEKGVNTADVAASGDRAACTPPRRTAGPAVLPELDIKPVDDGTCLLRLGGDDLVGMAAWVGLLGVDFEVLDPPELADAVRRLAERYGRAVGGAVSAPPGTPA